MIDGDRLEAHIGNYSDWRRRAHEARARRGAERPPKPAPPPKPAASRRRAATASRDADKDRERERRRLARRVETLEADVSKLEAELAAVRAELAADHGGDWQKLHTLADRERELDALLAKRHGGVGSRQRGDPQPAGAILRLIVVESDRRRAIRRCAAPGRTLF